MMAEIQTRGSNLALQYGVMAASAVANDGRLNPTLPLTYFKETVKVMSEASSPQEAATQGVIALGALLGLCLRTQHPLPRINSLHQRKLSQLDLESNKN